MTGAQVCVPSSTTLGLLPSPPSGLDGAPERGVHLDLIPYFCPSFQGLNTSEGVITCD
jgi:hypothetical protein